LFLDNHVNLRSASTATIHDVATQASTKYLAGQAGEGRHGAGDESLGSHLAGDGAENHVVSSG
jgi:hypothetical protein